MRSRLGDDGFAMKTVFLAVLLTIVSTGCIHGSRINTNAEQQRAATDTNRPEASETFSQEPNQQKIERRSRRGNEHYFPLNNPTSVLTEAEAIQKAQAAFEKDGHDLQKWKLTRAYNPPSTGPDGVEDVFFDRFSFNPRAGRVHFTDGQKFISYNVELKGDRIVCWRFRGL